MSDKPASLGAQIRQGIKGIHGAGEAIRGTVNQTVDETFHSPEGAVRNKAIADRGVRDVKQTDDMIGQHHGVKSGSTSTTGTTGITGTTATTTPASTTGVGATTGAGAHSGAPGSIGSGGSTATGAATGPTQTTIQEEPGVNRRF